MFTFKCSRMQRVRRKQPSRCTAKMQSMGGTARANPSNIYNNVVQQTLMLACLVCKNAAEGRALLAMDPEQSLTDASLRAGWKGGRGALYTTGPKIVRDSYISLFNITLGVLEQLSCAVVASPPCAACLQ